MQLPKIYVSQQIVQIGMDTDINIGHVQLLQQNIRISYNNKNLQTKCFSSVIPPFRFLID